MASEIPTRRAGRPSGLGYPTDAPILDFIADAIVLNPSMSVRAAIIAAGKVEEADIRRLHRHFKSRRARLIQAAHNRRSPQPVQAARRPYSMSFPYGVDLARMRNPIASLSPMTKQLTSPSYLEGVEKIISNMKQQRDVYEKIVGDLNHRREVYDRLFGDAKRFSHFADQMMKTGRLIDRMPDHIRTVLNNLPSHLFDPTKRRP